jgi:putative ubiquitin-RnfH superfamily antitoxin RatB of RatAB toxin-antitoxin module
VPTVHLARACADDVRIDALELPPGATIAEALSMAAEAGLLSPEERGALERGELAIAVNGRVRPTGQGLRPFDRIELLGPLTVDPKIARQRRVAHRRAAQARDKWSGPGR